MFKNITYILLIIMLFFSGCSDKSNVDTPAVAKSEVVDNDELDELDEFDSEFEEEDEEKSDPLRGYNIVMTNFNDGFYTNVFDPVARGYNYVIPESVRRSINNFFHNLMYPIRFINNILQGKFANATEETGRFVVNTTVGLLGLFDPAKEYLEWEPHNEDFGQTLGYWGVGSGYHIVLPFLGPSNMRDMFSMYPDSLANPVVYNDDRSYNLTKNKKDSIGAVVYGKLNDGSLHLGEYEDLKKDAVDLYPFLRDIYEQRREQLIKE